MLSRTLRHASALCLLLLTIGCSTRLPAGQPATITFACPDYMADYYRSLAERFSEASGHTRIEIVSADAATGHELGVAASDDVQEMAREADTFIYDTSVLDWEPPQGVLVELTELAREDERLERNDLHPAALALVEHDGHLWGLPAEVDVLYYRPSAFREEGIPFPEIGWTWEAWLDAALRLTVRDGGRVERYAFADPWPGFSLAALATQAAGPLVESRDGLTLARLDDPAVAEVLAWYADLPRVHGVMLAPSAAEYGHMAVGQLIDTGQVAMWVDRGVMREQYALRTDGDVGLAHLPEEGSPAAWARGAALSLSAGTAHPAELWEWITFVSRQAPFQYAHAMPARRSVAEEMGYWEEAGESAAALRHGLDHGITYPPVVWVGLQRALEATLQGESAGEALVAAQSRVNEALAGLARGVAVDATPHPVATPAYDHLVAGVAVRYLLGLHQGLRRVVGPHVGRISPAVAAAPRFLPVLAPYASQHTLAQLAPRLAIDGDRPWKAVYMGSIQKTLVLPSVLCALVVTLNLTQNAVSSMIAGVCLYPMRRHVPARRTHRHDDW